MVESFNLFFRLLILFLTFAVLKKLKIRLNSKNLRVGKRTPNPEVCDATEGERSSGSWFHY